MKYAPSPLSLSIMVASLLAGTALVRPEAVSAATADLQAQTGWAITRVASMSQGSYCTMAQKYSNDTVLTIAKNQSGEYSLAFDFQNPKFQAGKSVTAAVKAGSGSAQNFEVQPSSPQAIVIGLGADEKFISALESSGKMQLDVAGDTYAFNIAKFKDAQSELATCMSSMKTQTREAKDATKSEAQLAEAAEAGKKAAAPVVAAAPSDKDLTAVANKADAKVASKLSAEDLTSAPVEPLAAPAKTVSSASKVAPAAIAAAPVVAAVPVSSSDEGALRAENEKLKQSLSEARRSYENQMNTQQRVPELQEKLQTLDMENAKLKEQIAKASAEPKAKEETARLATELDKTRQDLAKANEENKTLKSQVATATTVKADADKSAQTLQLSQRELDTLKAENQTLKNQLQIAAKEPSKAATVPVPTPTPDLSKLKTENETLKAELAKLSAEKASVPVPAVDPAKEQELIYLRAENEKLVKEASLKPVVKGASAAGSADLQKRVSELQAENATLKTQLASGDKLTPMPSAAAPLSASDQENLRGQIRDLKSQLEIVESESAGLRKQLETAQKNADGNQIKAAGGNWDLEQATRRYQESQREIRRLGGLLEEDRVKCAQEKKDIEYMLFDPEVAKPAQISMLNNMEDQLTAKDARIAELENSLKTAKVQPASGNAKSDITFAPVAKATKVDSEQLLAADVKPMVDTKRDTTGQAQAPAPAIQAPIAAVSELPVPTGSAPAPVPVTPAAVAVVQPTPLQPRDIVPPAVAVAPAPIVAPAPVAVPVPVAPPVQVAQPVVTPQPVAVQQVAAAQTGKFQTSQDFTSMLQSAGVTIRGTVQPASKASAPDYKAFSWQTDSLYGSAEQRSIGAQAGFEPAVKQYIDRAKSRCQGDFAAVPAQISGSIPAEGYEIACVSGQNGSSASVLFTYKDGIMTTVAHEGRAEAMDIAMDARDRVASRIATN